MPNTVEKQKELAASNADVTFYQGKVASAKFFAVEILSTVKVRCDIVSKGATTAVDICGESFAL